MHSPNLSLSVFTLEDEQIAWTDKWSQIVSDDKSSDVKTGRTNFQTTKICPSVKTGDFLKTICPSRQTSRPKSDLNSHSDGLKRTNGQFASLGGMELPKGAIVCGKFAWKLAELAVLNSH